MKLKLKNALLVSLMMLVASAFNDAFSQNDTTVVAKPDTVAQQISKKEKKDNGKRKDEFIVYAGVSYSQLGLSSNTYDSESELGYQLGFSYRRGKFFYWQAGGLFNNSVYGFTDMSTTVDSTSLTIKSIDVPLTGGINVLSFTNRVAGLRAFASVVPSFVLGVNENAFDIEKDDINTFLFYGQVGVGANVAFFIVDVGYNFGFQDLLNSEASKPGQLFVNLGFRF